MSITLSVLTSRLTAFRAYEIRHMHGKEPPPVEILEQLTAKGSDILSRNVDNFKPPALRGGIVNGGSDSENEDARTPEKDGRMDVDDPVSGGRTTRGILQFHAVLGSY